VQIKNVSSAAIRIPFSPSLADLQPADPSQKFVFFTMIVELSIEGTMWSAAIGGLALYGDDDHTGTMLTLHPGEWIQFRTKGRQNFPRHTVSVETVKQTNARTTIYHDDLLLTRTASAMVSKCISWNETNGSGPPIQINER